MGPPFSQKPSLRPAPLRHEIPSRMRKLALRTFGHEQLPLNIAALNAG